nr:immunoglobulin heavy chain junction region [Macaca mulatta]
CAKGKWFDYW